MTVGATLLMGGAAQAACICTVNSLADPTDPGHTTLRDAVTSAETSVNSGSTITFASGLSGTITLGSALPQITRPTTIQGPGAGQLTISGDDASQILYLRSPTAGFPVSITGLTLSHGNASGADGGAIHSYNADLTVSTAVLSGDRASGYGGAIFAYAPTGSLTVRDSTLTGNNSGGGGGAIYDVGSPVTIQNTTLSGNQAAGRGGAIGLDVSHPATIENSTLTGNTAGIGGGLYSYAGYDGLSVSNSTVAGNSATNGGGVFAHGAFGSGPAVLRNSIVANNTVASSAPDLGGAFASAFSLVKSTAGATFNDTVPGSSIIGKDAQLGGLEANGGPTQTMKPALSSPAVDKGSDLGLGADQRGAHRPFDFPTILNATAAGADGSDIGAFELQPSDLPSNGFKVGKLKGKKLTVTLDSGGTLQLTDAAAKSSGATFAKAKRQIKPSSASGGPGAITIALKLVKSASRKLRQAGKLKVRAAITFTPTGGLPGSQTAKLKLKTTK